MHLLALPCPGCVVGEPPLTNEQTNQPVRRRPLHSAAVMAFVSGTPRTAGAGSHLLPSRFVRPQCACPRQGWRAAARAARAAFAASSMEHIAGVLAVLLLFFCSLTQSRPRSSTKMAASGACFLQRCPLLAKAANQGDTQAVNSLRDSRRRFGFGRGQAP